MNIKDNRLEFLAQIASLYYDQNKTQQEIADITGITRSAISRALDEAREKGVIQITVNYPWRTDPELEEALQAAFNLKAVRVLKSGDKSDADIFRGLGKLAAEYFSSVVREKSVIGISWGTLLYQTIRAIDKKSLPEAQVLQLVGGTGSEKWSTIGPLLAPMMAERLDCSCRFMNAPMITKTVEISNFLMQEPVVRETLEKAKQVDIALVGIGALDLSIYNPYRLGYVTAEEVKAMRAAGAVGDVCGYHYSIDGTVLDLDVNKRIVHVGLDVMRKMDKVIGIAGGLIKAEAIFGALSGGLVNVLVTDETAAQEVLRLKGIMETRSEKLVRT
jgi:DNA-binding transcriptional regulator LsrR (DeoR family)